MTGIFYTMLKIFFLLFLNFVFRAASCIFRGLLKHFGFPLVSLKCITVIFKLQLRKSSKCSLEEATMSMAVPWTLDKY